MQNNFFAIFFFIFPKRFKVKFEIFVYPSHVAKKKGGGAAPSTFAATDIFIKLTYKKWIIMESPHFFCEGGGM